MNGSASVSTTSVSARDGFEWWAHMVGDIVMPVSLTSPYADRFHGTATSVQLTDTDVSDFAFSPMSARRAAAHIRSADPEQYFLFLVHDSPIGIEQCRNNSLLTAGDMALFDTSHPLSCEFLDTGRLSHVSLLRLPRATLPLPQDRVDRLLGTPLPARTGSGALLASYLTGLRTEAGRCDPAELRRLGAVALALSATFLAARTDSPVPLASESRRQVLLARIRAFIDANLADPGLGPAAVAAHHHISVRLLHLLFHEQPAPETVGATIRRLRLERSRADLADRSLGHRGIGEIAGRWGFRHQADFSRAFRRAYGMPPSDFRRAAFSAPLAPGG
ncbi:helix-turn-helix domain-containing protein [Streptomyces sp. NBC_01077]|uniref:AraC-like ligand-binding domain-containing protein n=1 Tax=Streptomyces sp. NBC_01077 TaxID=2903746 RepID=UPI003868E7C9|nr:helix-turn-helix domain-containing protein [Streptomyces sp. NBC_01077]